MGKNSLENNSFEKDTETLIKGVLNRKEIKLSEVEDIIKRFETEKVNIKKDTIKELQKLIVEIGSNIVKGDSVDKNGKIIGKEKTISEILAGIGDKENDNPKIKNGIDGIVKTRTLQALKTLSQHLKPKAINTSQTEYAKNNESKEELYSIDKAIIDASNLYGRYP